MTQKKIFVLIALGLVSLASALLLNQHRIKWNIDTKIINACCIAGAGLLLIAIIGVLWPRMQLFFQQTHRTPLNNTLNGPPINTTITPQINDPSQPLETDKNNSEQDNETSSENTDNEITFIQLSLTSDSN